MKLLIGYDGSEGSETILSDLARAGLPGSVEAIVLSSADVWPVAEAEEVDPHLSGRIAVEIARSRAERTQAVERMRAAAAAGAGRIRQAFPGWTVSAEAVGDSPAWAIIKRADVWEPDLVVVGSRGRTAMERVLLGSVSRKVLHSVQSSVRIARPRRSGSAGGTRLLIGVDGSNHATVALQAVKARVWPRDTLVRVVAAVDAFLSTAPLSQDEQVMRWLRPDEGAESWVHAMVEAAAEDLRAAGINAEPMVQQGDPKHVLVATAGAWAADCIFLGARGLNAVGRALLGSVSAAVAARAHCSVEVARTRGREEA